MILLTGVYCKRARLRHLEQFKTALPRKSALVFIGSDTHCTRISYPGAMRRARITPHYYGGGHQKSWTAYEVRVLLSKGSPVAMTIEFCSGRDFRDYDRAFSGL